MCKLAQKEQAQNKSLIIGEGLKDRERCVGSTGSRFYDNARLKSNRPASRPLKVRFAQSEFNILCVLHKLSERKKKGTSVIQANSKSKVTFQTIKSLRVT